MHRYKRLSEKRSHPWRVMFMPLRVLSICVYVAVGLSLSASPTFASPRVNQGDAAAHQLAWQEALASRAEQGKVGSANPNALSPADIVLFGHSVSLWLVGLVVLLVLFVGIVIVGSVLLSRSRAHRLRREAEFAEANRQAMLEVQRIKEAEMMQRQAQQVAQTQLVRQMYNAPQEALVTGGGAMTHSGPIAAVHLYCPRCGANVQQGASYCPQCQQPLVTSDSGHHLQAVAQSTAPLPPTRSLADQPTVETSFDGQRDEQGERTLPYMMQQLQGRRLGFVVGTRSDPGIKRKHKPNEDSLFAAQGVRVNAALPQQLGLFVVADGMGGHANGQDASRLAIQTIVDYMLPRMMSAGELSSEQLRQLLVEGVQQANMAVHQQNMALRADMGTTMTAALVVDTTAYIANVGDSRTYLYRQSESPGQRLIKITQDHSVVASLVDAGIIKPEDIYTHPKRNQIYRSLGEKPLVEVDGFSVHLQEGDKLLLCSDGLWDMVRDPQIEEVLQKQTPDPARTGDALVQAALAGGGEDNVSVIVVNITQSVPLAGMSGIQLLAKPEGVHVPQL